MKLKILLTIYLAAVLLTAVLLLTPNRRLALVYAQASGVCSIPTGTTPPVTTGLLSVPNLSKNLTTSPAACVIDPKAAFAPYKIPSYDDLKSLYYTQSKNSKGTLSSLSSGSSFSGDKLYTVSGDLTVSGTPTGSGTEIIFVDGNLSFGANYTYATASTGTVFIVKGNVNIDPLVTQINAIIISSGIIYTGATSGNCTSGTVTAPQLVIYGSLISNNQTDTNPIRFCRTLTDNSQPAEKIIQQPKYLAILRDLMSTTLQKWSEIDASIPTPGPATPAPSASPTPAPTTYTLASGFSGTQGLNNWYYYYKPYSGNPAPATYGTSGEQPQPWYGASDNLYWYRYTGSTNWMMIDQALITGGDTEIAVIYWKATAKGTASATVTEKRRDGVNLGNGYVFGIGYIGSLGSWPGSWLAQVSVPSSDTSLHSSTTTKAMNGGDYLVFYQDSNSWTYGDAADLTISITFTPN